MELTPISGNFHATEAVEQDGIWLANQKTGVNRYLMRRRLICSIRLITRMITAMVKP